MSSDKYIHENVENKIYSYWEEKNLFKPKSNKKQFSIVILEATPGIEPG